MWCMLQKVAESDGKARPYVLAFMSVVNWRLNMEWLDVYAQFS